jgi:hypothetical protein
VLVVLRGNGEEEHLVLGLDVQDREGGRSSCRLSSRVKIEVCYARADYCVL